MHFGRQVGPKSALDPSKTALEVIFFKNREFSRNLIKTNEKSITMTLRSVPKRPKMLPRRLQDGLEAMFFSHRFLSSILIRFGSDLGAILEPFWSPNRSFLASILG